ncbi:MAG: DUF5658 family protein [Planctomycetia bacterium]
MSEPLPEAGGPPAPPAVQPGDAPAAASPAQAPGAAQGAERAAGGRRGRTPLLSPFLFVGRRRGGRRDGERPYQYVDRPGAWMVTAFAAVLALSLFDAWFTLDLLRRGAEEANPVMLAALALGDRAFVFIKTVLTILAMGFLCLHKNWPLGRLAMALALLGYSALTAYHIYAQATVPRLH